MGEQVVLVKGIPEASGYLIRREWLPGEVPGASVTWSVVWEGSERASYPRRRDALVDLWAWQWLSALKEEQVPCVDTP